VGRVSEEKRRRKKIREEKESSQKKEDAGARKGRKVANLFFSRWFVPPDGRKAGLLKRPVRSHLAV